MKFLKKVATDAEVVAQEYDVVYYSEESKEIVIQPSKKIVPEGYVDLNLPSGTLWAKCNIGAALESDYGQYFQWGGIVDMTNQTCDWSTVPFNDGLTQAEAESSWAVHSADYIDGNGNLRHSHDAAYYHTHGQSHIPTATQIHELTNNTIQEWTTSNGVNGMKFIASNDNNIFIPASGFRIGDATVNLSTMGILLCSTFKMINRINTLFVTNGYAGLDNNYMEGAHCVRGVID